MKIKTVFLYDEPSIPQIEIHRLQKFLKNTFPIKIEIRKNILRYSNSDTPQKIASTRIFNPRKPFQKHIPSHEEIIFEKQNIEDTSKTENIIMYDGFELQKILMDLIPSNELSMDYFHVFFTNKLTCTYDYNDYRYHGRALIGSNPTIISTTGIIEAPAKPREYYLDLISNYQHGLNVNSIKEKYKGEYLEYNDPRLSKVIEGYLLQSIFYYETGEEFCSDKNCRLFNAHWQKDLLQSQIEISNLCEKHQKKLRELTIT